MRYHGNLEPRRAPALIVLFSLLPCSAAAIDLQQSASVMFHDMPWGRTAEITIEYLPSANQAMLGATSPEAMAEMLQSTLNAAETNPAVTLLIPGLEYGMTGVFENVRIESGQGISVKRDGRVGSRLAPTGTEYTGKVTISEFTENHLRGSYQADLYNKDMSDREIRARARDHIRTVVSDFDIDMSLAAAQTLGPEGAVPTLPELPDSEQLSDKDAELLRRMQEAGVPPETQGMTLEILRSLPPERVDEVLESYDDSY